jgi:L-ascorbate metabolism protein UlaG (beta-lactamase superfamily)
MRVVFLGHACYLVEVDGVRVLTDPWLTDPIFEGHVEHDPPLTFGVHDLPAIDVVALTHGHLDHFNAPSLAALPDKSVAVVHPPVRFSELDRNLRLLGFSNLHPHGDYESFEIGGARITPTPSLGVLEECAYLIEGSDGKFWDGADAPQAPQVIGEIAARFGAIDLGAFSHNSFDQPALLGLPSMKPADHGPQSAAAAASRLKVGAALPGASNMRWRGPRGAAITRKAIRRSHADLGAVMAERARDIPVVDLQPGDAWSRAGGVERRAVSGAPSVPVAHDYIHTFLETGERWCPVGRPSTEDTLRRDLPARMRRNPQAAAYLGQTVELEITGADAATYTVDFGAPDADPVRRSGAAPFAIRIADEDWKDLYERKVSWQVLLVSDRLAVTRFRPGEPPNGLHFVYALQALFP